MEIKEGDEDYKTGRVITKHRHDSEWKNVSVQINDSEDCFKAANELC